MKKLVRKMMFGIAGIACAVVAVAEPGDIWDGVYSVEQAVRGAAIYEDVCVSCHSEDLRGDNNTPSLVGVSFMFLWEERSLGELLTKMQTDMPPNDPNSLRRQSYRDVLAFILQANHFPAGQAELSDEAGVNSQILIVPRP